MSDAKIAEQLWLKAHEEVKNGNLAQSVRDLSKCYELLKTLKDPRLAQVHRRWVEVHKLYQQRKAKAAPPQPSAQPAAAQQPAAQQPPAQQPAAQQPAARQPAADIIQESVRAEPRVSQAAPRTLGEQAEAAANEGQLEQAIAIYERLLAQAPSNDLARERVAELRAAHARAGTMTGPAPAAVAAAAPSASGDDVAFLEALLHRVQERRRVA